MPALLDKPRQTRLTPHRGESQISFVARGSKLLYKKIPDATKRTRTLLRYWREAGRDGRLAQITAEHFPQSQYITVYDRPVFKEHQTADADGNPIVYDRNRLAAMVRACNERILDTGDFAALSEGHSPTEEQAAAGQPQPKVLGMAGPFRLGIVGNRKPVWAIFADEHYKRDVYNKAQELPRRSCEVWLEDGILDPIALLGAETPRLDVSSVIRNCRLPSGRVITKYSAAYPAGGSTAVPSMGGNKHLYAAGANPMDMNQGADDGLGTLSDADINKIIQGIAAQLMQSKPMQFVMSQMPPDWSPDTTDGEGNEIDGQDDIGSAAPEVGDGTGAPAEAPGMDDDSTFDPAAGTDAAGGQAPPPAAPAAPAAPEGEPDGDEATPEEMGEMDDDDKARYSAGDRSYRKGFMSGWRKHKKVQYAAGCAPAAPRTGKPDNYSRLTADNARLAGENAAMKKQLAERETQLRHTDRYSRLSDLATQYAFDPAEEFEEIKDLPEEAFQRHLKQIHKYSRLPDTGTPALYVPEEGAEPTDLEKKRERYSRRAMEISKKATQEGKFIPYQKAFEMAIAEEKQSA